MKTKTLTFCSPAKEVVNELIKYKKISTKIEHELSEKREKLKEEVKLELEKGYQDGFKEGLNHAFKSLVNISNLKQESIKSLNGYVFEIVKNVLEEVVSEQLELNPESITSRITRAVDQLTKKSYTSLSDVTLKHSPEDQKIFDNNEFGKFSGRIRIEMCNSVRKGIAILETPYGKLEIDPENHLKNILGFLEKTVKLPDEKIQEVFDKIDLLEHEWPENTKLH